MGKSDLRRVLPKPKIMSLKSISDKSVIIDYGIVVRWCIYEAVNTFYDRGKFIDILIKIIKTLTMRNNKIIFVFDGLPSDMKVEELKRRRREMDKTEQKLTENIKNIEVATDGEINRKNVTRIIKNHGNEIQGKVKLDMEISTEEDVILKEVYKKHKDSNNDLIDNHIHLTSRVFINPTIEDIEESKKLFRKHGIRYIHDINEEADVILGVLCRNTPNSVCISSDNDMITHLVPRIIKKMDVISMEIQYIEVRDITKHLGLTKRKLQMMCIVTGNDYYKISNVGPSTALQLVKLFDTIDDILAYLEEKNKKLNHDRKYVFPEVNYNDVLELFIGNGYKNPLRGKKLYYDNSTTY